MSDWVFIGLCGAVSILVHIAFNCASKKERSYWVMDEGRGKVICARCMKKAMSDDNDKHFILTDYCPNCGSQMSVTKLNRYCAKKRREEKHKK